MRNLYKENTANFPRLSTDKFFIDYENSYSFKEITDKTARFVEEIQLLDSDIWELFVEQYQVHPDGADGGWRGEYFGKMMRGACFVYSYTKNPKLLEILTNAVKNLIKTQDSLGRISTYTVETEFQGWDIWCRKYVMLGMQYFLEINEDKELEKEIINSMRLQADYLISKLGTREEGKIQITRTTRHWYGLNASSILEPIVRLYSLTKEQKYLDFANYIANEGGTYAENIFRLAESKELRLYQYPVTKAYEMASCFEGLLELYRITKVEWYKTAIINFADLVLEDELTAIGSAGCTHELFDHSKVRQSNTTNHRIQQETCVTVTLMKLFLQLNLLTGNSKYIDAFETSYYNAYLGAVNFEKRKPNKIYEALPEGFVSVVMPFDSYSPLTRSSRGNGIGGFRLMRDNKYYGCCVCIGAAGVGSVHKASLLTHKDGLVLNMYIDGEYTSKTPSGKNVNITVNTLYPADNKVLIKINAEDDFILKLRNPEFSKNTLMNGKVAEDGYNDIKVNKGENSIEIIFSMPAKIIKPIPYGSQVLMNKVIWGANSITIPSFDKEDPLAKDHIAIKKGPLMLAQDSRLGYDLTKPANIKTDSEEIKITEADCDFNTLLCVNVETENGETIKLCDYQSAGKLWTDENQAAVWIKNK